MHNRFIKLVAVAGLNLLAGGTLADPVSDLINQTGLNALFTGSATGGGVEIDVLNPTGTGDNDALGLDLFTPENGLGLSLAGTELVGFGNTTGSSEIPLDFLGLDPITKSLGLAPDSALVDAVRNTAGPEAPLVASLRSLSNISSDSQSPTDAQIAIAIADGDTSGNGELVGVSVLGGDNSGNGGLAGVGVLNGDNAGNGNTAGVGALNGNNSGTGDTVGVSVINGDNSGSGGTAGAAVLSGDNSGNSGSIAASIINGDNSGSGGAGSVAVGNDNNGESGNPTDGTGNCQGVGCGDSSGYDINSLLAAASECSEGDADGDGVCDEIDDCKDTPAGAVVFSSGCHFDDNTPLVLRGVNFEFDSIKITESSVVLLKEARDIIAKRPKALISIDGHTDGKGSAQYNLGLSHRRAAAIHQYFVANGIKPEQLTYRGFGKAVPIAANTTEAGADYPEGRALNRRVELSVLDRETFLAIKAENNKPWESEQRVAGQPVESKTQQPQVPESKLNTHGSQAMADKLREQRRQEEIARAKQETARAQEQAMFAREEAAQSKRDTAIARREISDAKEMASRSAREQAAREKIEQEKSDAAAQDYEDVLKFMEETGTAERNSQSASKAEQSKSSEPHYSLDVVEPNNSEQNNI